jgi:hypothetical protein
MTVFYGVAPGSLVKFTDISEVLAASIIRAMMEAASTSETSVIFYQIALCNTLEDSYLHIRCHENLKSHKIIEHYFLWNSHLMHTSSVS